MNRVAVRILHVEPGPGDGPLSIWLSSTRRRLADRHRAAFRAAGVGDVRIVAGAPDDTPYGARLRRLATELPAGSGLVELGSGSIPLATQADLQDFVEVAGGRGKRALANNRFSADIVALTDAHALADLPDLPADNALPRWLVEAAGYEVCDRRLRWRLAVDLDTPLDALLVGELTDLADRGGSADPGEPDSPKREVAVRPVRDRIAAVAEVARDQRAELIVAGRTSAGSLRWLETHAAARVRALVEERGLRAASRLALAARPEEPGPVPTSEGPASPGSPGALSLDRAPRRPDRVPRPPASILGALLDRDGPEALGADLAALGDAAIVDTRVLLAHRFGPDERSWPSAEDRFASDLLLPERVDDPWLQALTRSATTGPIPILLGGHTLVGPGVRLVLGRRAGR